MGACEHCRDSSRIRETLRGMLFPQEEGESSEASESESELDEEETINFKEWEFTDRAYLKSRSCTPSEYLDQVVDSLQKLLPHEYITRNQSKYVWNTIHNLEKGKVVVLLDFSENYNYIVQDEIQSYHWNKDSCTVHPAVIYYNDGTEVKHKSLCFLSDDLRHDVTIVELFQSRVVNYIKENIPDTNLIEYVSDGCAGQYKNCHNLKNLCDHKTKYGIEAKWSFFATSHGKSPVDGVGGKIKRELAMESIRRTRDNQIIDVESVFEFCKQKFKAPFELFKKEQVQRMRNEERSKLVTLPGTRSFHCFVPHNDQIIKCKRTSLDEQFSMVFDLTGEINCNWSQNTYVAFVLDLDWYIGLILEVNDNDLEAEISILTRKENSRTEYNWCDDERKIVVPLLQILSEVKAKKGRSPNTIVITTKKIEDRWFEYCKKYVMA